MPKKIPTLFCLAVILSCYAMSAAAKLTLQASITGIADKAISDNVNKAFTSRIKEIKKPTADDIITFYQNGPKVIQQAVQPFGYFKAQVKSRLGRQQKQFIASYMVDLGMPVKVTKIDLAIQGEGSSNPGFQKLIKRFPIKQGDILNTETYKTAKKNLLSSAINHGYIKANLIKSSIVVDISNNTASISLHLATGPRYKFGNVTFSKTPFSDGFLRRFLPFQTNEFYSGKKLQAFQDNLNNSNYFQQVTIEPEIAKARNLLVPITVHLTAKKSRRYTLGAGFGTDTGPRGLLGLELRNLTKNGQYATGFIRGSTVDSNAELHYLVPGHNPITDRYDLGLAASSQHQDYGDIRSGNVSLGYTTTILAGWKQTLRLTLQQEYDRPTGQEHFDATLFLMPSINWLKTSANDPVRTTKGWKLNLNFQGAARSIGSKTDFAQATIDGKIIQPLFTYNTLAVLRGTYAVTAMNEFEKLPLSLQYFTGGAQTIRGYSYNSIGPGRNMVIGSLELRQKIYGDFYLAAFTDVGDISDSFKWSFKKSIGAGLVWLSPIGTMELTVAEATSSPGHPKMIQFNMGPEF